MTPHDSRRRIPAPWRVGGRQEPDSIVRQRRSASPQSPPLPPFSLSRTGESSQGIRWDAETARAHPDSSWLKAQLLKSEARFEESADRFTETEARMRETEAELREAEAELRESGVHDFAELIREQFDDGDAMDTDE